MTYLKDQLEPAIDFVPCMSLLKLSRDKLFSHFRAERHVVMMNEGRKNDADFRLQSS